MVSEPSFRAWRVIACVVTIGCGCVRAPHVASTRALPHCATGPVDVAARLDWQVDDPTTGYVAPAAHTRYAVLLSKGCVVSGVTDDTGNFEVPTDEAGDYCVEIQDSNAPIFYYMVLSARRHEDVVRAPYPILIYKDQAEPSATSLRDDPAKFLRQCQRRAP